MEAGVDKKAACENLGYIWISAACEEEKLDFIPFVSSNNDEMMDGDCDISMEERKIFESMELLPRCESYVKLRFLRSVDAGDHDVAICEVLGVGIWNEKSRCVEAVDVDSTLPPMDEETVLYTGFLRKEGII